MWFYGFPFSSNTRYGSGKVNFIEKIFSKQFTFELTLHSHLKKKLDAFPKTFAIKKLGSKFNLKRNKILYLTPDVIHTYVVIRLGTGSLADPASRQDSIRSGYVSDHEALASNSNIRQQASIDSVHSQDARMCYLTSSEVSF